MNLTARAVRLSLVCLTVLLAANGCQDNPAGGANVHPDVPAAVKDLKRDVPEAHERKIVLLGFDSCDPYLVDEMIRQGLLPNFARLKREGASGKLRSIPPYLSPVVWTSISTGMRPDRHGILDFTTKRGGGVAPISSDQRQADTVWELLSRAGEDVGVVGWLVSYPADPLPNGFMVTERVGRLAFEYGADTVERDTDRLTEPASLRDEITKDYVTIDDIPLGQIRPFAEVDGQEYGEAYAENFSADNLLGNLRLTMATAETFRNIGLRKHREEKPRFFACYFEAMDVLSHLFMRYASPRMPNVDKDTYLRYRSAIQANYQWHDRVLGEFMDQCDEDTTLILVSDHGFKSGKFRLDDPSEFHARSGAMWHRQYGSIFAWGNGIKPGFRIQGSGVLDIAPTILASMGYPVPRDMAGRALKDMFEDGLDVRPVPTYYGDQRRKSVAAAYALLNADDVSRLSARERERLEQLEALNYTSGDRSESSTGQLNLGQIFMARGRYKQALEQFEAVLQEQIELRMKLDADGRPLGGPTPRVHFAIADAQMALGNLEECEKHVNEAVGLANRFADAIEQARAAGRETPDITDTPQQIREQVKPQEFSVRVKLALKRQDFETAHRIARQLRDLKPRSPNVHVIFATVMEALSMKARESKDLAAAAKYHDEAIKSLERALGLEPDQFYALKEVARLRLDAMRWKRQSQADALLVIQRSMKELESALELFPTSPDALNNYTIALLRMGLFLQAAERREEATEWYGKAMVVAEKTVDLYPTYAKAWANRAYVQWKRGEIDEAFESAVKANEAKDGYPFDKGLIAVFQARGMTLPGASTAPK